MRQRSRTTVNLVWPRSPEQISREAMQPLHSYIAKETGCVADVDSTPSIVGLAQEREVAVLW